MFYFPQGNNDEQNLWPLSEIGQQPIDLQSFHLERAFLQIAAKVLPNLSGTP